MRIGEYIKCRRAALGYTQQNLADNLSISKQAVHKWENDLSLPDIMIIPELAAVLQVSSQFISEAIWMGNSKALISHFVMISVEEKDDESYVIYVIESKDFLQAKERYDALYAGADPILPKLAAYYAYDNSRRITMKLQESEYDSEGAEPIRSLVIEHCDLTPVVEDHIKKGDFSCTL